jgi:hypothetical protein
VSNRQIALLAAVAALHAYPADQDQHLRWAAAFEKWLEASR